MGTTLGDKGSSMPQVRPIVSASAVTSPRRGLAAGVPVLMQDQHGRGVQENWPHFLLPLQKSTLEPLRWGGSGRLWSS